MEAFSSKDVAMQVQKKILSRMASKSMAHMFVDDTSSEILDELYRVSKEYTGNRGEAHKIMKDLVKVAVKIGVLYRHNKFSADELRLAEEFKKKLHHGAMTAISFYEVKPASQRQRRPLDSRVHTVHVCRLSNLLDQLFPAPVLRGAPSVYCRDLLLKLVDKHLTPKSHGRINHVFNHFSDKELLTQLYNPKGPFKGHLQKICTAMNKLVEEGKL
ncbi:Tumor necrosis factor alpha-induced protein 8-like protein 2 [Acipenser ruthenus]|uniref:Tumor necrosis factor alpha-induced protein 8-like protein 2 n=1 Tax=Acipenser ruthenus TaxID=7906 RepID=A0A444UXU2_ACIRT|nr:Tumor necrosis factor alpha-induced protein 8-like protein 2 [Acipenser ruthenus]